MRRALPALAIVLLAAGCGDSKEPKPQGLASDYLAAVPTWVDEEHLHGDAAKGAKLFAELPCLNCHTYRGAGDANLGAPDLSSEGTKSRSVAWLTRYVGCPRCTNLAAAMPNFKSIGTYRLHQIAVFLEASK